jgi:hypothetical protein
LNEEDCIMSHGHIERFENDLASTLKNTACVRWVLLFPLIHDAQGTPGERSLSVLDIAWLEELVNTVGARLTPLLHTLQRVLLVLADVNLGTE